MLTTSQTQSWQGADIMIENIHELLEHHKRPHCCHCQDANRSLCDYYRVFHRFGLSLTCAWWFALYVGLCRFSLLPKLPYEVTIASKVVKTQK